MGLSIKRLILNYRFKYNKLYLNYNYFLTRFKKSKLNLFFFNLEFFDELLEFASFFNQKIFYKYKIQLSLIFKDYMHAKRGMKHGEKTMYNFVNIYQNFSTKSNLFLKKSKNKLDFINKKGFNIFEKSNLFDLNLKKYINYSN